MSNFSSFSENSISRYRFLILKYHIVTFRSQGSNAVWSVTVFHGLEGVRTLVEQIDWPRGTRTFFLKGIPRTLVSWYFQVKHQIYTENTASRRSHAGTGVDTSLNHRGSTGQPLRIRFRVYDLENRLLPPPTGVYEKQIEAIPALQPAKQQRSPTRGPPAVQLWAPGVRALHLTTTL